MNWEGWINAKDEWKTQSWWLCSRVHCTVATLFCIRVFAGWFHGIKLSHLWMTSQFTIHCACLNISWDGQSHEVCIQFWVLTFTSTLIVSLDPESWHFALEFNPAIKKGNRYYKNDLKSRHESCHIVWSKCIKSNPYRANGAHWSSVRPCHFLTVPNFEAFSP